jgi:2-amino-4-hydroxy-6-hydroxymethyldihydropteridine diphosphokinase
VEQRLAGSLAAALLAAQRGARILRVHDVAQTLDVLKVWQAVEQASHETIAIGLGANLGDARATLAWALQQLQAHPRVTLRQVSSLYRTRPVEAEGPDYLNAVALLHTSLEPEALLQLLQDLELQAGRERPYRNAPRTLDLDLLLYGQRVLNSATLTLPHPRMHQRRFVLEPLAEVAPALAIPHAGPLGTLLTQVAAQVVERCDGPEEWLSALARNRPTTSVG